MPSLVLTNARVLTLDPGRPEAWGVEVEGGVVQRLLAGREELARRAQDEVVDLRGLTLCPSFADAHVHLQSWASGTAAVDLSDSKDLPDALNRLLRAGRGLPAGEWLRGRSWNRNAWTDTSWPTRDDLDGVCPDRPAVIDGLDLHSCWVNSLALETLGLAGPLPPEGAVGLRGVMTERKSGRQRATGVMREDAAQAMWDRVPALAGGALGRAIRRAAARLYGCGVTAVADFDGLPAARAYAELGEPLHVLGSIRLTDLQDAERERLVAGTRLGARVTMGCLKLFLDGSLGSKSAWMAEPFETGVEDRGMGLFSDGELARVAERGLAGGWTLALHAIGDRANRQALALFEQVRRTHPRARLRIEHAQLLHPADVTRFAELGVLASMQPSHVPDDIPTADREWGLRSRLAYALASLGAAGTEVAFGSDVPVGDPDPRAGLEAAVWRQDRAGRPPGGWYPAERIGAREAFRAYTVSAQAACGLGLRSGRIAPGCNGDVMALEGDPLAPHPRELAVRATWIAGEAVHDALQR
ncbi:MAG: amidohydrolase [Candidatus Wallbacteria bacterium]|nr:amidohydrolase [Candidatus Wallbacteria bacterium]